MKKTLWSRNFTLLTVATIFGAAGGIAGEFALSFLVFDETGSTFASALCLAIQFIPGFVIPLFAAPWLDRLPRKPFLVGGDALNGVIYLLMGLYLLMRPFSYIGYLAVSLVLSSLGSFDALAYESIYPNLIPKGMESKGYAVSSMMYPVLMVIMMPLAAILMDTFGVANILLLQGALSICAALIESRIDIKEENRMNGESFSLNTWKKDIFEAISYLKKERGLCSLFAYSAISGSLAGGAGPILIAFFRTAPGFTSAMYAMFSVAECIGRSVGGAVHYKIKVPKHKKFKFTVGVYTVYALMDMCLLWLSYPFMLINRAMCGFLGVNSATLREEAVQGYIPDEMRARVNALDSILYFLISSIMLLILGALGELLDYRLCLTLCGIVEISAMLITVWKNRQDVKKIYEREDQ